MSEKNDPEFVITIRNNCSETFAKVLRELRMGRKKQEGLAQDIGVSKSTISRWEQDRLKEVDLNGKLLPVPPTKRDLPMHLKEINRICKSLGCHPLQRSRLRKAFLCDKTKKELARLGVQEFNNDENTG